MTEEELREAYREADGIFKKEEKSFELTCIMLRYGRCSLQKFMEAFDAYYSAMETSNTTRFVYLNRWAEKEAEG